MKCVDSVAYLHNTRLDFPSKARKQKAERTKHLGEPVELTGKALDIAVIGSYAFVAENTTVIRKIDLEVCLSAS